MKTCITCERNDVTFSENRRKCNVCRTLERNKEKVKETKKRYRQNHGKENVNKLNKKWREENKERYTQMQKNHYEQNKEMYIAQSAKRRAKKVKAITKWSDSLYIRDLYANAKEASVIFKSVGLDVQFEVDHIVPLIHKKVCGLHTEDNLQILTRSENRQKSNKFMVG